MVLVNYSIEGGRLIARITFSSHDLYHDKKKTCWNKRRNFNIKINILEFLAKIHFQLWNSSFRNGHCTHHQNYPSLEIVALFPIALGVEIFLCIEHKHWVKQFHGTKKTWILVALQIGSCEIFGSIATTIIFNKWIWYFSIFSKKNSILISNSYISLWMVACLWIHFW